MELRICESCKEESKYFCKGRCRKCYQREWKLKSEEGDECIKCGIKPGEINPKGKITKALVKKHCNACYYLTYRENKDQKCKDCGIQLSMKRISGWCAKCKRNHSKRPKPQNIPKRTDIEPKLFSEMLTLFRRYRDGYNTPVDSFRVIDVYLRVFEGYSHIYGSDIESSSQENQIILMLKSLKQVYDNV